MSTDNRNTPQTSNRTSRSNEKNAAAQNERYYEGRIETGMNKDSDEMKITGDESQKNVESPKS